MHAEARQAQSIPYAHLPFPGTTQDSGRSYDGMNPDARFRLRSNSTNQSRNIRETVQPNQPEGPTDNQHERMTTYQVRNNRHHT
jgi:hypothetical protein